MNNRGRILIVDDDPNILEVLEARLTAADFHVLKAGDAPSALKILEKDSVSLMISDMKMPNMSGMDLFSRAKQNLPGLPVIFLTAYGTIPDAVSALKQGAVDYISKPFDGRELILKVDEILGRSNNVDTRTPSVIQDGFYWGKSLVMKDLYLTLLKVAASHVNVLILGESGVGKECIARFIHENSTKKSQPYVVVDCGSTPTGILESELFGHMKGSFTHAVKDKKGLIEASHKGTLFLDEIGNISQDMQSRLLRFLEEKTIRRVGTITETRIDCRVLSATNADLAMDIENGDFRQDLYYRLKGVTLKVPPLRERKEDLPGLIKFFVDEYTKKNNLPNVEVSQNTLKMLQTYSWPGNIRELKNSLEAGVVLCRDNTIQPSDLQLEDIRKMTGNIQESEAGFSLEDSEKNTIIRALIESNGVQKDAAQLLKISRRSIHYKIKKFNIQALDYK